MKSDVFYNNKGEQKIMEFDGNYCVVGDVVEFKKDIKFLIGTIVVSDYGGALGYSSNTYDIFAQNMLYKHVEEKFIVRTIEKTDRLIYWKKRIETFLDALGSLEKERLKKIKIGQNLLELNKQIKTGKYLVGTESGSKYMVRFNDSKVFIIRKNEQYKLKKDSQSIRVLFFDVRIGLPAFFILEPLGKGDYTIRQTTRVIEIKKIDN
jgi:ribosomal protein L30E